MKRGVVSYYAAETLPWASDPKTWLQCIEQQSQADVAEDKLPWIKSPVLQVLGDPERHLPGVSAQGETQRLVFVETLADKTIDLLAVQPGQVIWIWASTHSLDLVEALAYRIRACGAFWTLRLTMEPLLRRIGRGVAEPYLALVPEHELRWLGDVDAIAEIRDHGGTLPDVPLARRRAMGTEWMALIDEAARRGIRRVEVLNPTPALAAAYGLSAEALRKRIWPAVNVDYRALDALQERVGAWLARAGAVHITCPLGSDLRLRIDGRPVHLDTDGIPRGEVYVAPLENSAEGVAVIEKRFIRGKLVEQLRLMFAQGRVVQAQAADPSAADSFWELLQASRGDKDVIAEFAIGLNPGVTQPVGDIALDEKIGGSVHIAIGMNEHFGGRNRSNLHLDLVILRPTVWLDGEQVVIDGVVQTGATGQQFESGVDKRRMP